MTEYKSLEQPLNDQNDHKVLVDREYLKELKRGRRELWLRIEQAVTLIKDGRFIEALRVLESEDK